MLFSRSVVKEVPLKKILLGGENDLPGYKYSLMTGNFVRPSTRVEEGPHALLLKQYDEIGDSIFDDEIFKKTAYYTNARDCIELFGEYFPKITSEDKILNCAQRFVKLYKNESVDGFLSEGHSKDGEIIELAPIQDSDCYQLIQGNHRCAFAVASGKSHIKAKISKKKVTRTPVQFLLENLQWEEGDRILYQPLACPELESRWVLARRCSDRFEKMDFFLKKNCSDAKSVLDLGSYYGWFVNEFGKAGYDAFGVEKDNTAIMVGNIFFEKTRNKIFKNEIVRFLTTCEQYDAVCCLSIMHHFITGRIPGVAEHMLHLLDSATKSVLFFEMADSHEQWFAESLAGWTVDSIEAWVLKNSTFEHAVRLGADNDGVGAFKGNFGRTLIAFTR